MFKGCYNTIGIFYILIWCFLLSSIKLCHRTTLFNRQILIQSGRYKTSFNFLVPYFLNLYYSMTLTLLLGVLNRFLISSTKQLYISYGLFDVQRFG